MAGFWLCIPLAVLSLTGAALAFPDVTRAVLGGPARDEGVLHGERHARRNSRAPFAAQIGIDEAVAKARAASRGELAGVTIPGKPGAAWRVQLRPPSGPPVFVDVDGQGTKAIPPAPAGDPRRLIHQLHGGEQTPLAWRLWITAAGLAPLLLGVSGVLVWARRRGR
jgi:uncharacterized iron-regulated membrane protein